MKTASIFLALGIGLATSTTLAQFTPGCVVVLQVDGTVGSGNSGSLVEYNPTVANGSPTYSVALPYNGGVDNGNNIVFDNNQHTARISRAGNGASIVIPGYANNCSSLSSSPGASAPRVIATVKHDGTFIRKVTSSTAFSTYSFRSAAGDGFDNFWAGGIGDYTWYLGTQFAPLQVQAMMASTRAVICVDGKLYTCINSGSSGYGVLAWDTLPITSDGAPYLAINATGIGFGVPSVNSLAISGNTAYIGDFRSFAAGGGIQRWDYNGSNWVHQYTLAPNGSTWNMGSGLVQNIAADFSGAQPVIYVTSSTGSGLWAITDLGSGTYSALTVATSTSPAVFRGVALSPKEPVPPVFTVQPADVRAEPGETAQFGPVAATGADPKGFQWFRNGVLLADGPTPWDSWLTGSTSDTLTIQNVHSADAGTYWVIASNDGGSTTSSNAVLRVVSCCTNSNQYSIQSDGSILRQWLVGAPGVQEFLATSGTLPPLSASFDVEKRLWINFSAPPGHQFYVTPSGGPQTYSLVCEIQTATTITNVCEGTCNSLQFLGASGSVPNALSSSWFHTGNNQFSVYLSAPITASFTFTGFTALVTAPAQFAAAFTNVPVVAGAVYVNNSGSTEPCVSLDYPLPVVVATQPASQIKDPGEIAVLTAGVSATVPVLYRWQKNGSDLTDGPNISGSATPFLFLSNLTCADAGRYNLKLTYLPAPPGPYPTGTVYSQTAVLTVRSPLSSTLQPGGTNLALSWNALVWQGYQIQYKTNFAQAEWMNWGHSFSATGSVVTVPVPIGSEGQRFYRVVLGPGDRPLCSFDP